jgi:Mrp family chromosome partitioning ATPase
VTKIYEAYKKRNTEQTDFKLDLVSLGDMRLFPVPEESQQAEIAQLADMLLHFKPAERGALLCFASSVSGEGTSFVSYNAARLLAYVLQRRTLWIDANFLSPQRKLEYHEVVSFAELLKDPERVAELPTATNLTLVPAGADLKTRVADGARGSARELMSELGGRYDFVVIDCPPVLETIETGQLANAADGLVMVVQGRRLKREVIRHSLEKLGAKDVNVLGAVLNRRTFELPKIIYDRL